MSNHSCKSCRSYSARPWDNCLTEKNDFLGWIMKAGPYWRGGCFVCKAIRRLRAFVAKTWRKVRRVWRLMAYVPPTLTRRGHNAMAHLRLSFDGLSRRRWQCKNCSEARLMLPEERCKRTQKIETKVSTPGNVRYTCNGMLEYNLMEPQKEKIMRTRRAE